MNAVNNSIFREAGVSNTSAKVMPSTTPNKSDKLGQSDFLKLMITQFRNQDPFKPMENGEFVAQMASFGTVSGIQDLQNSLSNLVNSLQSDQSLQASSLIGRTVQVPASTISYVPGKSVSGAIEVPASSNSITITIKDRTGAIVTQLEHGPSKAGMVDFSWDGTDIKGETMPKGDYKIEAEINADYKTYSAQAYVNYKVDSVTLGSGNKGLVLNLENGSQSAFNQIRKIM